MIEVRIDSHCQAWGQCVFDSPKVFDLEDGERVRWRYLAEDSLLDSLKRAERNCPNRAISLVENYDG